VTEGTEVRAVIALLSTVMRALVATINHTLRTLTICYCCVRGECIVRWATWPRYRILSVACTLSRRKRHVAL